MNTSLTATRWLDSLRRLWKRSRPQPYANAGQRRCRPRLEVLEQRCTPTTFTVNTNAWVNDIVIDPTTGVASTKGGTVSIIDAAFLVANETMGDVYQYPGPNTINFASGIGVINDTDDATDPRIGFYGNPATSLTIDGGGTPNSAPFGQPDNAVITTQLNMRVDVGANTTVKGISCRGIDILNGGSNQIYGNFLGVKADGKTPWGDGQEGVYIDSSGNTIGGTAPADRNVMAGHTFNSPFGFAGNGVFVDVGSGGNNTIEGNYIGTDATGTVAVGNTLNGVRLADNNNTVVQNLIEYNSGDGVAITDSSNNTIKANVITGNTTYAIEVDSGSEANQFVDNSIFANGTATSGGAIVEQAGVNGGILPPVLASADGTTVMGQLPGSTSGTDYTVEFFNNTITDPRGDYEGQTSLGQFTVSPDGQGNFSVDLGQTWDGALHCHRHRRQPRHFRILQRPCADVADHANLDRRRQDERLERPEKLEGKCRPQAGQRADLPGGRDQGRQHRQPGGPLRRQYRDRRRLYDQLAHGRFP